MQPNIPNHINQIEEISQKVISGDAYMRAIIDHIPNPIWSIDRNGNLSFFNKFLESSIRTYIGHNLTSGSQALDLLPEQIRSSWEQIFSQVLKGDNWNAEYIFDLGKEKFYSEISGTPISGPDGEIEGAIFLAQDITHRKNAEEALRDSEEKFRQLAENISDSFILFGEGRILYMNPAFERVFSRSREVLVKDPELRHTWIHPDDADRITSVLRSETYINTGIFNEQYRITTPDGSVRWIWNRCYPVRNRKGDIYRSVSVVSDITLQKDLESTLLKTRAQHKALLDNIPHMAWLKNAEGKYISVNESFARYYNLSIENIVGKSDFELFSEERAKDFTIRDQEVIASGRQQRIEKHAVRNSKTVWTETFKTPIFNEQGELLGITGISIDISEQKELEEALRMNEERFRGLLQFSSDALTMLNKGGEIIFESSLEGKISGFAISDLIGKPIFEFIHPEDLTHFRKAFSEVLDNPCRTVKIEFRGLKKSGQYVFIEAIFANHLETEQIKGIVMNSRDISRRKTAEIKERKNQANQAFLSNTALDFLSFPSETNLFEYLGLKLEQIVGSSIVIVSSYHEQERALYPVCIRGNYNGIEEALEILKITVGKSAFHLNDETLAILTSNSKSLFRIHGGIFEATFGQVSQEKCLAAEDLLKMTSAYGMSMMRQGKLLGCIVLLTNDPQFDEEKQTIETFIFQASVALHRRYLELELIKARDKAEESDRIKTTFLANMSHEIRTPMNGILGFAQLLSQPGTSFDEIGEYVDAINNNGRLLMNLINDIIDISRIESGQVKLHFETIRLNELFDEVWQSLISNSLRSEKNEVTFVLEKGCDNVTDLIETDSVRLRQVLNNLLGNAIKFTPVGSIIMGYSLHDNYFTFYVKDSGIGIHPEKLESIFERFVQADTSTTRQYGGSGLGLAISRGFIEIMGGKMWAESIPGSGSSFYFTLPSKIQKDMEHNKPSEATFASNKQKKIVLIVEDDRFNSKYLETLLKRKGIETELAFTAREAFSFVEKNQNIGLVLMDIQLPVINGLEATRQIKKMRPDLPVIAQTANTYDDDRARCLEAGCDEYISKPINVPVLMQLVENFLSSGK